MRGLKLLFSVYLSMFLVVLIRFGVGFHQISKLSLTETLTDRSFF